MISIVPVFFYYKDSITKDHQFSFKTKYCSTISRRNFFTILISNIWNNLPADVAEMDAVNTSKNDLDNLCRLNNLCLMFILIFEILII